MPSQQPAGRTPLEAIQGVDASRRIAWARFYQAMEDIKILRRHNHILQRRLARFALLVSRSEELSVLDPDGALFREAIATVAALRSRAYGRVALEQAEAELDKIADAETA